MDAWEARIVEAIQGGLRCEAADRVGVFLKEAGQHWLFFVILGALFGALAIVELVRSRRVERPTPPRRLPPAIWAAVLLALSAGTANLVGQLALKGPIDRAAPSVRFPDRIEEITYGSNAGCFPSNHAAAAFAGVTALAFVYGFLRTLPAFAIAGLVALSRIYCGSHYPSDVLAGAALGILVACLFAWATRRWRPRRARREAVPAAPPSSALSAVEGPVPR